MPTLHTTIHNIPYSDGDDPIAAGDDLIESIVKLVDGQLHTPGDLKVGLQAGDHGLWLFADARNSIVRANVHPDFVALMLSLGYTGTDGTHIGLPDYRGRTLVGAGQHADVNSLTDNEGLAVGSRTPKHNSSINDPGHYHNIPGLWFLVDVPAGNTLDGGGRQGQAVAMTTDSRLTNISSGPGGPRPVDTAAYGVGNIFIFAGKP